MVVISGLSLKLRHEGIQPQEIDDLTEAYLAEIRYLTSFHLPQLEDPEFYVSIGEGSVKLEHKILGSIAATYFAIGAFGDFMGGVGEIYDIGKNINRYTQDFLFKKLLADEEDLLRKRQDYGIPGKINRLFEDVQRGHISPDEATNQLLKILEKTEDLIPPKLISDFEKSAILLAEESPIEKFKGLKKKREGEARLSAISDSPPKKVLDLTDKMPLPARSPRSVEIYYGSSYGGKRKKRSWDR